MRIKTVIVLALVSIAVLSTVAAAADWTRRPAIGIRGPVWIPFDDIYGPEPFRMGLDVSLYLKYGITRNFVFDLSGTFLVCAAAPFPDFREHPKSAQPAPC